VTVQFVIMDGIARSIGAFFLAYKKTASLIKPSIPRKSRSQHIDSIFLSRMLKSAAAVLLTVSFVLTGAYRPCKKIDQRAPLDEAWVCTGLSF
jgi:hypothetical protein